MRSLFLILLLIALLFPTALGEEGRVRLPTAQIPITLSFNGQDIPLEGDFPPGTEVFIRVRSSKTEEVRLNRLGKVGIFWMPVEKAVIGGVPQMYLILSSSPLSTLPEALQKELGVDPSFAFLEEIAVITMEEDGEETVEEEARAFLEGLIKIKKDLGLYRVEEEGVRREGSQYRATLRIPSSISPGEIHLDIYKIHGEEIVDHETSTIQAKNVGLGGWLIEAAEERSLLYGIVAVLVALFAGFAVGALFKGGIGH
jgi:hypothetical protein